MGTPYLNSYFSVLAQAAEEMHDHGIVVVISAGNHGNVPFVMGDFGSTNNAITVGATDTQRQKGLMASFSSRGLADGVRLKPDLSAPGGTMAAAAAGSGAGIMETRGTSFSSPFVTGAVALILERCPECSPFAIKALLMNNASRNIRYHVGENVLAPLSWSGSGELQVKKSLSAELWAFSVEDVQPSISLGLINAFRNTTITRTIRLNKLSEEDIHFRVFGQYRDEAMSKVLQIEIKTSSYIWDGPCSDTMDIEISFHVNAALAPDNHLTSSGKAANDPTTLDRNEFDGWIVIEYKRREKSSLYKTENIALPFHAIIRKASDLRTLNDVRLPNLNKGDNHIDVNLFNNGVGTAQVDSYELLHISTDDSEAPGGSDSPSADFNYIGFRSLPGNSASCRHVLEFAFHLWESHRRLVQTQLQVHFDLNRNGTIDYTLANRGQMYHDTDFSDCRILEAGHREWSCAGFAPDHGTNSATTILRVCSNDVGIENWNQKINVSFSSYGYPNERILADKTPQIPLRVPTSTCFVPSYDIPANKTLHSLTVTCREKVRYKKAKFPLGILLVTNAWRSPGRTGAATPRSEAIALASPSHTLPSEKTPDVLAQPLAINLSGPDCTWLYKARRCGTPRGLQQLEKKIQPKNYEWPFDIQFHNSHSWLPQVCKEKEIPRLPVEGVEMDSIISETFNPSAHPTNRPSHSPSTVLWPTQKPTSRQTPLNEIPSWSISENSPTMTKIVVTKSPHARLSSSSPSAIQRHENFTREVHAYTSAKEAALHFFLFIFAILVTLVGYYAILRSKISREQSAQSTFFIISSIM